MEKRPFLPELFLWAANLIPLSWRIRALEGLALLIYALDLRHRIITRRNMALAFPDLEPGERSRMAREAFRHLGRVLAEFSFTPRLTGENLGRYLTLEGRDHFQRAYERGRGVLFLTAHFGNWEWMAASFALLVRPCHVVVRPLDNQFLDALVDRLRTWTGNRTVPKQKAMGRILRLLREGQAVGILLDQNMAWQEGVFVDFFGQPACTNTGLARLARKTGAAVLPAFNVRQADGRYKVIIGAEVELARSEDRERDVKENTARFSRIIEGYVRAYPDHWLWLHQRWKTRPWQVPAGRAA
ncbi:MAG: lysophospholipid acyltransferase family protein [Deltaproteobacteria bacterium]|nr:lysophospholipid acyltransferase family protein [Deltaproteobacteria bacterium]